MNSHDPGPGKCNLHHIDRIWILKEFICPRCEDDLYKTPKSNKGIDGPDGFQIIDIDIDFDWKKKGGSGI